VTVRLHQLRHFVDVWANNPTLVYDADFLIKAVQQRTNQNALGAPIEIVLRDAISEGYLYVDQFRFFLLTWRAFIGLTDSGKATWAYLYPALASQFPVVGGTLPPD
jgi:hypothetical protein